MMADRRRKWPVLLTVLPLLAGGALQSPRVEAADAPADEVPADVRIERLREAIERERDALERERATRRSMAEELERMRDELERTREELDRLQREATPDADGSD